MPKFEDRTREIAAMAAANEARDRDLRGVGAKTVPKPTRTKRGAEERRAGVYLRFDPDRSRVLDVVSGALGVSPTAFAMQCVERTLDDLSGLPEVSAAIEASGTGLEDAIVSRLGRGE